MSKSRGNIVNPQAAMDQYGLDPLRYFLLKEGRLHVDAGWQLFSAQWLVTSSDFNDARLKLHANELANVIGNRCDA